MTIDEKLAALTKEIDEKRAQVAPLTQEVRDLAEKAESDEEFAAAKEKRAALDQLNDAIKQDEERANLYKQAIKGQEQPNPTAVKTAPVADERRAEINAAIRSKSGGQDIVIPRELLRAGAASDTPTTTGITSPDAAPTIPVDISYVPQREVQTVVDLKPFVNVFAAKSASGKYPVLKNVTDTLHTVGELEKNPALGKPQFSDVEWAVATYRGAIPLSQESIDDSAADLIGIVNANAQQLVRNTNNAAIATVLKTFPAKTIGSVDDLKTINNVDLDPAYTRAIVASASFYNALDTLKDGNGRYLLQDSITSPSGKTVLGIPVVVVSDTTFGAAGEAHAFIGDIKRAVLFADRAELTVRWVDNDLYGQYLRAGIRFGVAKADSAAGFFLTYTASTPTLSK
ncbi:phage major capsid protein [Schleiferilactobacillus shenzhenensis]|uniref:Phage capsid-like C-terminal domain-containing protein n=1 Tax=Schleiferilactobacillus shenzhenensis LY-73 TaxID=1231336 RepID=U4TKY1_9LACO|nr:phage major capsid protein [Schleiferilactobacillus shenzhenensis]ERL64045.1 hypothetical protein L248_1692 [Schleiferilactobacillus shenzhenensis LY-73]